MPINSFIYPGAKVPPAWEITNSCRFNDGDSPYLSRTMETATNRKKCTISVWLKKCSLASNQVFFGGGDSNARYGFIDFDSNNQLFIQSATSDSTDWAITTSAKYRDPSAWMHVVATLDSTESTNTDRVKLYVNGKLIPVADYSSASYPSLNYDFQWTYGTDTQLVGKYPWNNFYWDGYMAEFHYIDGTAYAASQFGEYDDDSPTIWKPKQVTGLTYGNQGFYLDFSDSSDLGADSSGNSNDFTENNIAAADQATDTPTNNFCTISPIDGGVGTYTFSEGNCQIQGTSTSWYTRGSTFAVTKGKWYWECEFDAGTMIEIMVGIHDTSVDRTATNLWVTGSTLFYNDNGGEVRVDGTETTADYGTLTAGDIMGFALNMDDKQITIYDNGSAIISNLSIGSNITEAMPTFLTDATNIVFKANFGGCPAFSISSGNSDANGYGNFEYAVPSGYYALCSKNLAEFG